MCRFESPRLEYEYRLFVAVRNNVFNELMFILCLILVLLTFFDLVQVYLP
jgi:hypothetical protein